MLVLTAVFISLSVFTLATDVRKCYWCGPLADQVHRSRRAPPCTPANDHVTACDPGLHHCAIVATSPPYSESRLCVKYYQDECYSQYCNSTKTWRMTCPCRGDLCNGPNTERENEDFAVLAKLVAKTRNARIKRSFISSPSFISSRKNNIDINATQSNISQINDDKNTFDGNILSDHANIEIIENENIDVISSTGMSDKVETIHIEDDASIKEYNDQKSDHKNLDEQNEDQTFLTTRENEVVQNDEVPIIIHEVKPSELPTAEALQQNASLVDIMTTETKFTTATAFDATVAIPSHYDNNADDIMMITIEPTVSKNNTATKMHRHILAPIFGIILHTIV